MSTAFLQVILSGVIGLIAGVIAAIVTTQLALRRFYREKWWEAKMQTYAKIIEALHHMKHDLEISLRALEEGRDNSESEFAKAVDAKQREAWAEIRKTIDIGDFILSQNAMEILRRFNKATDEAGGPDMNYYEYLDGSLLAANECLPALKMEGRKDLGLPALKAD